MALIDTHAHLDDSRFADDLEAVLARASVADVTQVLTIATTAPSSRVALALATGHENLFASVGIHPNNAADAGPDDWDQVLGLVESPKVVALGETGLDRHWQDTPFPMQEDYFARHLAISRARQLPVVIHCREAEADVLRMLREDFDKHGPLLGVMHSFTGAWETAQACLAMGLYLSFAGMVTYKNAQALRDVAVQVPDDRILVETDSPYLAPVPVRGQRNEPAFVVHTAACLAKVRQVDVAALSEQTTQNARRLFQIV